MNYTEALEFIHGIVRFGSRPGLKHIGMLLERMGNPQNKLRFIHVAGTNGKGSTCAMLSHILARAGYKTGLYISPFVLDFCERIQLNNEMIPREELAKSATLVRGYWDELDDIGETPTEFEVVVAIAMDYFLRMECDVVVLEVGLGGRLDATNIIERPLCSVITSIDIDHTEYLGNTIAEIAFEKCGVIKSGGITVSYPKQPEAAKTVIAKACADRNNRLFIGKKSEVVHADIAGSDIVYGKLRLHIPFAGAHQVLNAVTAVEAIKAVRLGGLNVSDENVIKGIAETAFPSRLEILCEKPMILLDGAHNISGAKALGEALKLLENRRIHALVSCMADKDVRGMLAEVLPRCHSVTAYTIASNPRAMSHEKLASEASRHCANVSSAKTPTLAMTRALSVCKGDDVIVIFGSLYSAAEIRPVALRLNEL